MDEGYKIVPADFAAAAAFFRNREKGHLNKVAGWKFGFLLLKDSVPCGALCCGDPTPARYRNGLTIEIRRWLTDGGKRRPSSRDLALLDAAFKAATALRYERILIAQDGLGSFEPAGWRRVGEATREIRREGCQESYVCEKEIWEAWA